MPTYRDVVDHIAATAESAVAVLWQKYAAGTISRGEFDSAAETLIEAAGAQAAGAADLALAQRVTELTGEHRAPLGLAPTLTTAGVAAVASGAAALYQLGVATRAAVHAAGQDVWTQGLIDQAVAGWRRITSGSGCPVCSGLARADFLPSSIRMYTHRGCGCHPDPVIDDPGR